jgi:hypothetical protein
MPKGYSEALNRRRTDNTMAERKGTKKDKQDLQNTTQKATNRVTRTLTQLKMRVKSGPSEG